MSDMTDELKPVLCGCGGEAEIAKKFLMGNLPDVYVLCGNCSIRTGEYYSEAEAIEAWNRAMGGNVVVYGNPDAPKSKTVG